MDGERCRTSRVGGRLENYADVLEIAIPKKDTIFRFEVPLPEDEEKNTSRKGEESKPLQKPLIFELHGNQFEMRAADRANKKFKWKSMEYI